MITAVDNLLRARRIIDDIRNAQLARHIDRDEAYPKCVKCGREIGLNDSHFVLDDDYYCSKCEGNLRTVIDDYLNDLIGRRVSDAALDAILCDCERDGL